jgi:STAS domain
MGCTVGSDGVKVALTHVTFLDARGITTLLTAAHTARQRGLDFRITGCSPRLLGLFDLVGVRAQVGWAVMPVGTSTWMVGLDVDAGRSSDGRRAGDASAAACAVRPAASDAAARATVCSVR